VDFRKLNDLTIGDSFPIPVISEILDALGKSKYFSTIDCSSRFLQVPVKLEDQAKTAFSTREGHFQYTRMPFGLKGAPATFQKLMTTILSGIQGIKCLVLEDLRLLVRHLTRNKDEECVRFKRGVFNFIGGISKILFGTMDNEDASYYAEKISNLEKEQIDFLKLSKEQITVVKSTLQSLNSTLLAVSENERILSKGLEEMARHVNEHDGEIKDMFTGTSMFLTVNEHNMQLERALSECRSEYDILIGAVVNSQKGILQPHIITPAQIMKQLKISQADIPSELSLPIPLSATYQNLIVNIIDLDVFIKDNFLVYVVCLKSKCTDFLFKCLLDSPEITSNHLQSMTLGKLHNGSNVFSTDHSNTGSHFL